MSAGLKFLMYALPALGACQKAEGEEKLRLEKEKSRLEEMLMKGIEPEQEKLQELYADAFRRMQEKLGENYWTEENVQKYWWTEHNQIIDNGEAGYEHATPTHREICKVKFWEIVNKEKGIIILKDKTGEEIRAVNYRHLELNPGQYVTTHKKHIAETITQGDYETYG